MFMWVVRLFLHWNYSSVRSWNALCIPRRLWYFENSEENCWSQCARSSSCHAQKGLSLTQRGALGSVRWELFGIIIRAFCFLDVMTSSLPASLAGAETCLGEMLDDTYTEPVSKMDDRSSEETFVFMDLPTGMAPPCQICLKMPSHIPLRETFHYKTITYSVFP